MLFKSIPGMNGWYHHGGSQFYLINDLIFSSSIKPLFFYFLDLFHSSNLILQVYSSWAYCHQLNYPNGPIILFLLTWKIFKILRDYISAVPTLNISDWGSTDLLTDLPTNLPTDLILQLIFKPKSSWKLHQTAKWTSHQFFHCPLTQIEFLVGALYSSRTFGIARENAPLQTIYLYTSWL